MKLSCLCPSRDDTRIQAPWGLSVQRRAVPSTLTRIITLIPGRPWDSSLSFSLRSPTWTKALMSLSTLRISEGMLSLTALPGPSGSESTQKPVSLQLSRALSHQSSFVSLPPASYPLKVFLGNAASLKTFALSPCCKPSRERVESQEGCEVGKLQHRQRRAQGRCCALRSLPSLRWPDLALI